jgi:hypothetical protein
MKFLRTAIKDVNRERNDTALSLRGEEVKGAEEIMNKINA